jgi:hypothetical protein
MGSVVSDERAIERLLNIYGHCIDDRDWDGMRQVFTADVVFDSTDFGSPVRHGFQRLRDDFAALGDGHPICHHATNIVVDLHDAAFATVRSKGFCIRADGSVFSCVYLDEAVRDDEGWRLRRRVALLRRPPEDSRSER